MKSTSLFLSLMNFRIWETSKQVVPYITGSLLLSELKIYLRTGFGFMSKFSANYFDCLIDCNTTRSIEIFGKTMLSSSRLSKELKYPIQSISNKPLIMHCLTQSNIVEHYLYSVIPLKLSLFQGKH